MKVLIREKGSRPVNILLPTKLVFNESFLSFGLRIARKYASDQIPNLDPVALKKLCKEICRIKSTYGQWELVDIESSNGDRVKIVL